MKTNIIVAITACIIMAGFLEIGARLYDFVKDIDEERAKSTFNPASIFEPHPFSAYSANPQHLDHNAQGFRAEKEKLYTDDEFNVVCLGGSSTYGTRVYLEDSYPYQLEQKLSEQTDRNVTVINAGLGGYSTPNIISLLSLRVVHLKPRVVIFYVGFNDVWNRLNFSDFQTDYSHAQKSWEQPVFPFWRHSRLLDVIATRLGVPSGKNAHIHSVAWHRSNNQPEVNWENSSSEAFEKNLITLISIARTHDAIPILVTQATDFKHHPLNGIWILAMEEYTDIIKEVSINMSVELIDIRGLISDKDEFFADMIHMNEAGNKERARIIAAYLIKNGIIE